MRLFSIFILLFASFISMAQVPENPEDISPLLIGEKLPDTKVLDVNGNEMNLNEILDNKPTVLVFYRGGWCPYCNRQLSGLAEIESEVVGLGYQIVAISPDNFQFLPETIEKDEVKYQLYSDPNSQLIQAIGIGFKTPEGNKKYIFNKTSFEASEVLPVPTVMVLDDKSEILFEYINPNYKTRLSPELLLAVLSQLRQ